MKRNALPVIAIGFWLLMTSGVAMAAPVAFTSVTFPGAANSAARGINNAGQLVGWYVGTDDADHGYLYANGVFTSIDVPGATGTMATGINNAGDIVGSYYSDAGHHAQHGFIKRASVFTTIDDPLAGVFGTAAASINDAGQVVGSYFDPDGLVQHGFLYSGGTFTTVDCSCGGHSTTLTGINNAGQIVGTNSSAFFSVGFVNTGGIFTPFSVPGFKWASATGINNLGQIVATGENDVDHWGGFVINGSTPTPIGVPGFQTNTLPFGINDSGAIVGSYPNSAGTYLTLGFILDWSCDDTLALSYASGALNLGFYLRSEKPGVWSTWLAVPGHLITLWSVSIPAISPAVSFTVPITGFPAVGTVGVLTLLSNATGLICADWQVVDTGSTP